jgi:OOP family OmpA-OmpF porin
MRCGPAVAVAVCLAPAGALAFNPAFNQPAEPTRSQPPAPATYLLPTGPFRDGAIPGRVVEGRVTRRAWRIEAPGTTTLELLAPLRTQLDAQGYRMVFECDTAACGGFDFRFALDVLPEPDMHVDLGDFRFLSAERGPDEVVGLLVSRSARAGFVQVSSVGPATLEAPPAPLPQPVTAPITAPDTAAAPPGDLPDIGAPLSARGHVVLSDLVFAPGSAELSVADYGSLTALARWMAENPEARITLVGHTDASGGLAANIDLSRRRAEAVRRRLIDSHGAPADRLSAEGAGFLAPLGNNTTEEGRALNRRVEAVLIGG